MAGSAGISWILGIRAELDGKRIEGTLAPLASPGTTVHVEAVIR
jgi:hypothetical protein